MNMTTTLWIVYAWILEGSHTNAYWHDSAKESIPTLISILNRSRKPLASDEYVILDAILTLIPKHVANDQDSYPTLRKYIDEAYQDQTISIIKTISYLTPMQRENTLKVVQKKYPEVFEAMRLSRLKYHTTTTTTT